MLAGHNESPGISEEPSGELFLGNPMMVLRDFRLENHALNDAAVRNRYVAGRPNENNVADADFRRLLEPAFLPPLDFTRDASWELVTKQISRKPAWVRQGPAEKFLSQFRMEPTSEGLLLKTPDAVERETRMYLWSPRPFEGDQRIEFDFRLELLRGLALVTACASGMQREDFITNHGVPKTGAMATILRDTRNYHWGYVRRVEAMRADVETQYVSKNPFGHKLHGACVPRLAQNRWYRLRLVLAANRLHGSFDGQTVFDLTDSAFGNNGPVYNPGRLGLRHMYNTTSRYRNLSVYGRRVG